MSQVRRDGRPGYPAARHRAGIAPGPMSASVDVPAANHANTTGGGGQLAAVHRLNAALVAATGVECIYEAAMDALIAALSVERAAILLFDPDGVMRFKAWRGLTEEYRQAVEGHNPWADVEGTPEAVVIADVAGEEGLGALRDAILDEGIQAVAFIPLLYGTALLGKFMLYTDRVREFSSDELSLAATVAGHVAFALEKRRLEDELRLNAAQLTATLNAVSDGITVQAPDGRLILANDAAARSLGFSSAAALADVNPAQIMAPFELFDVDGEPFPFTRLPGRAALAGGDPPEVLVRFRHLATGVERFSQVKARAVRDDAGGVAFAVNVFRDVTDRHAATEALRASEARLAFLASAGRRLLSMSLKPRRVREEVVDIVMPDLADWCVVREFAHDGRPARVALGPPELPASEIADLIDVYSSARSELALGESILVSDLTTATPEQDADHHLEELARLGVVSLMVVALRSRGRTIGVLTLAAGTARGAYREADLALVEEFANRVAASLDNARTYAVEHATAETLAKALLPGRLPDIPGLELAARYRAAGQVGGDFYDCFPVGDGTWLLVVGDVCGRGIHAAAMTGLTRHSIRAAALHAASPAAVLSDLNQLLLAADAEHLIATPDDDGDGEPSFCTVCLAAVTPTPTGARVVVSVAGHPLPLLVRANAEIVEIGRPGSLLGVLSAVDLSDQTCELGPGDALVMFTDGIIERRNQGAFFGEEHFGATLLSAAGTPANELAQHVEDAAVAFADNAPADDMALLAISVRRGQPIADP